MHPEFITFPDKTFNLQIHPLQSYYRQLKQATVSQVFCLKKKKNQNNNPYFTMSVYSQESLRLVEILQ